MNKQLSFKLPEIDREKTKEAVEAALERYRVYLLTVPEDKLPKITQSFTLVPPSNTNAFKSTTEDAAVSTIQYEQEREKFLERIRNAVNRLNYNERAVIIRRYLDNEERFDYEVYNELGMSERKYYRVKSRAFYKLAFILRLEVYCDNSA